MFSGKIPDDMQNIGMAQADRMDIQPGTGIEMGAGMV